MSSELGQQETAPFSKKRKPHKAHLSTSGHTARSRFSPLGYLLSLGISDGGAQGPNSSGTILYTLPWSTGCKPHIPSSDQLSHGATLISTYSTPSTAFGNATNHYLL